MKRLMLLSLAAVLLLACSESERAARTSRHDLEADIAAVCHMDKETVSAYSTFAWEDLQLTPARGMTRFEVLEEWQYMIEEWDDRTEEDCLDSLLAFVFYWEDR